MILQIENGQESHSRITRVSTGVDMRTLLRSSGFRIRNSKRADCVHCTGKARGTVSYNTDVAHCFRCGWATNTVTLARTLGLYANDLEQRLRQREETICRINIEEVIRQFDEWRERRIRYVSDRFRTLGRAATWANEVLRIYPGCEEGWEALTRYYHQKARLSAHFDFLCFTKASEWLETDSTAVEVFRIWRSQNVPA